jgi:predicted dehydrogenase
LKITQLCADNIVVEGRKLDDDGNVLLKFNNGANGILSSQIACGEENSLKIKVYGEKGGLEWHQMEPNTLLVKWPSSPGQIYRAGNSYLSDSAQFNSRTPQDIQKDT